MPRGKDKGKVREILGGLRVDCLLLMGATSFRTNVVAAWAVRTEPRKGVKREQTSPLPPPSQVLLAGAHQPTRCCFSAPVS